MPRWQNLKVGATDGGVAGALRLRTSAARRGMTLETMKTACEAQIIGDKPRVNRRSK